MSIDRLIPFGSLLSEHIETSATDLYWSPIVVADVNPMIIEWSEIWRSKCDSIKPFIFILEKLNIFETKDYEFVKQ